nr:mucin-5AC-like [Cherax quadricarinatus]
MDLWKTSEDTDDENPPDEDIEPPKKTRFRHRCFFKHCRSNNSSFPSGHAWEHLAHKRSNLEFQKDMEKEIYSQYYPLHYHPPAPPPPRDETNITPENILPVISTLTAEIAKGERDRKVSSRVLQDLLRLLKDLQCSTSPSISSLTSASPRVPGLTTLASSGVPELISTSKQVPGSTPASSGISKLTSASPRAPGSTSTSPGLTDSSPASLGIPWSSVTSPRCTYVPVASSKSKREPEFTSTFLGVPGSPSTSTKGAWCSSKSQGLGMKGMTVVPGSLHTSVREDHDTATSYPLPKCFNDSSTASASFPVYSVHLCPTHVTTTITNSCPLYCVPYPLPRTTVPQSRIPAYHHIHSSPDIPIPDLAPCDSVSFPSNISQTLYTFSSNASPIYSFPFLGTNTPTYSNSICTTNSVYSYPISSTIRPTFSYPVSTVQGQVFKVCSLSYSKVSMSSFPLTTVLNPIPSVACPGPRAAWDYRLPSASSPSPAPIQGSGYMYHPNGTYQHILSYPEDEAPPAPASYRVSNPLMSLAYPHHYPTPTHVRPHQHQQPFPATSPPPSPFSPRATLPNPCNQSTTTYNRSHSPITLPPTTSTSSLPLPAPQLHHTTTLPSTHFISTPFPNTNLPSLLPTPLPTTNTPPHCNTQALNFNQ